jgi:hypothetical protein
MRHLRQSAIILIIFQLVNCQSNQKRIIIELKHIKEDGCSFLSVQIKNVSEDSLFFPNFIIENFLEFYDHHNKNITDSAHYLANRVTGPCFSFEKIRDENIEFILSINSCFDYDTLEEYRHYKVNEILIEAIELEYSNFQANNSVNILNDSMAIKNFILQNYCPFVIIPPKKSIYYCVNLEDIVKRFKTIKIVANIDYSNYNYRKVERINFYNNSIYVEKGVLNEVNDFMRYNEIVISDTIVISE